MAHKPVEVTSTTFHEISKMSEICSSFRKNVSLCIGVVHIFLDLPSLLFSLSPRNWGGRGGELPKFMTDIYKVLFKIFCIFFAS